jgi:hypothetical protein
VEQLKRLRKMKLKYRINIIWSNENNCYLVSLPDFPGQQWRTHGETYLEAFHAFQLNHTSIQQRPQENKIFSCTKS